jgi:Zn-dependent protease with chaperone function
LIRDDVASSDTVSSTPADPRTARRLLDGVFAIGLAVSLAWCLVALGTPPSVLGAVLVASFGLEFVVGGVFGTRLREEVPEADLPPALRAEIRETAAAMGVGSPRVVDDEEMPGVTVFREGSTPVLVVSTALLSKLDAEAARAVIAHELAHLRFAHLRRAAARDAITHVVGLTVCWTTLLGEWTAIGLLVAAGYLAAGVFRRTLPNRVVYVLGSLGVVLVGFALATKASRLEECEADDAAAAHTSPAALCAGLYGVATVADVETDRTDAVTGPSPFARRRGRLEALTATHPTLEHRLARFGFAPEDFEGVADSPDPRPA